MQVPCLIDPPPPPANDSARQAPPENTATVAAMVPLSAWSDDRLAKFKDFKDQEIQNQTGALMTFSNCEDLYVEVIVSIMEVDGTLLQVRTDTRERRFLALNAIRWFCQYLDTMNPLEEQITSSFNCKALQYEGSMDTAERERIVDCRYISNKSRPT